MTSPNRESRANGLLWSLCCNDQSIQPVQAFYLEVAFYCSRPGRGASPKYNASPKESVSCASRRLVFIVRESIRLIFIVLYKACYCFCTKHIAGCVPTFAPTSKNRGLRGFWLFGGEKKPGLRYRKPRLLLREISAVTVFSHRRVLPVGAPPQLSLATPVLRRGMPKRWRRSHRHLRLTPSLRASSVSVMWSWCSRTKCWK
jgi:hypothetical protein